MCLAEFSPPQCKVFFCDVLEFVINFVPKVFGGPFCGKPDSAEGEGWKLNERPEDRLFTDGVCTGASVFGQTP